MNGLRWCIGVRFEPRDLWVGVYWDRKPKGADKRLQYWDIYVCPLPMVAIRIFQAIPFDDTPMG